MYRITLHTYCKEWFCLDDSIAQYWWESQSTLGRGESIIVEGMSRVGGGGGERDADGDNDKDDIFVGSVQSHHPVHPNFI